MSDDALAGLLRYSGQDDYAQNKDMIRKESISARQFLQRQMIHEKGLRKDWNRLITPHVMSRPGLCLCHIYEVLSEDLYLVYQFKVSSKRPKEMKVVARVKQRCKPK